MAEMPMNILLVEDNPGDARLLREMFLENVSYSTTVTHVESIRALQKHVAVNPVDVILLDLGLPDADGLTAVRLARASAPHVPLVVLTGLNDEALAVQELLEGGQDCLVNCQIDTYGLSRAMRYAVARQLFEMRIRNDVIGLKLAEAELRESELMLRLALDGSGQGVWRWDVG